MPVTLLPSMRIIECVIPSCKAVATLSLKAAVAAGWRGIVESNHEPPVSEWRPRRVGRTHIGFCPRCSAKYSVTHNGVAGEKAG
jgi:hypothetical protein